MIRQIILLGILLTSCTFVHAEFVHPEIAHDKANVSSVKELREVMTKSHQEIVMAPGTYVVSDLLDSLSTIA